MIPSGSLQDFTLTDLLQIVSLNASTGTVRLESEGRTGALCCDKGEIIGARAGDLEGEEAVHALFDWSNGSFRFEPDRCDVVPANVNTPLAEIAKEGIRRLDQWRAIRGELPHLASRAQLRRVGEPRAGLSHQAREALDRLDPHVGRTVGALAQDLKVSELSAALALLELQREGLLLVEASPDEALRSTFKRVSEGVFHRFASISGLKMIQGLEDHLNGLARERAWEIRWKNGAVQDGLAAMPDTELLAVYRDCLHDQLEFVARIHGNPFLDRTVDQIASAMSPEEKASLSLLGLLPVGS